METYTMPASDIEGMTLSSLNFDYLPNGFQIIPDGFNIDDYDVYESSSNLDTTDNNSALFTTNESFSENDLAPTALSKIGNDKNTTAIYVNTALCEESISIVLAILFVTGIIANIVGYIQAARNRGVDGHRHNFFHIFLANILLLLPLPFSIAARFHGFWEFGNGFYKFLSFTETSAQAIVAFQLTFLMQICAVELARNKEKGNVGKRKIVCYFLWILGFGSTWPAALYDDYMAGVIMNQSMARTEGGSIFTTVDTIVCFVIPGVLAIFFLMYPFCKGQEEKPVSGDDRKREFMMTKFRMSGLYMGVFVALWFPYRAWKIVALSNNQVQRCETAADIFLCVGTLFSTIMPLIYVAVTSREKKKTTNAYGTPRKDAGETEKLTEEKKSTETNNNVHHV